MRKVKVLITGSRGMLAHDLIAVFKSSKRYQVIGLDKDKLDITNSKEVQKKILRLKPEIIINAAAWTDVEGAEEPKNKQACRKINAEGPKYLAIAAKEIKAVLVQFSTDYVFGGRKTSGYKEDDRTNPLNYYGLTKLQGEKNIQKNCKDYYILRTSWLFGKHGKNFIETMLKLGRKNDKIDVVSDVTSKPTYTLDVAKSTKKLIEESRLFGIYHIVNEKSASWYVFAKEIFKQKNINIQVKPIASSEFFEKAKRPKNSSMLNTKYTKLRPWPEALKDYLSQS